MKILVVDDNRIVNKSISKALEANHFLVDSVFNGEEAVYYIQSFEYDCVVLDIMMPKIDGYEVVRTIRNLNIKTPVLFLSAKQSVEDRVKGLLMGGDDYLMKPFSMKELIARIQVLIRQKEGKQDLIYTVNDLVVNASSKIVTRNDKEIQLTQKEYLILLYLIRNKNKILSRSQILEHVWDIDYSGSSNIVDVYINFLRKKLDHDKGKSIIETVYTIGYVIKDE